MNESPRPEHLDVERTTIATGAELDPTPADPASEPGLKGTAELYR